MRELIVCRIKRRFIIRQQCTSESINNRNFSDEKMAILRNKLLAEREGILKKNVDQSHFHLNENELSDPIDEACANHLAETENRFRNRENFYLKKIEDALQKMAKNEYGICSECNVPISFERLNARPTADLCIHCKEEQESDEQNNIFGKRSKSLGKTINELGRP